MKNEVTNIIVNSKFGPIVINKNDTLIGQAIQKRGTYNIGDINDLSILIHYELRNKNKIFFYDIGANVGFYTLGFAKIFKEKIFIRSFESQKELNKMILKTISLNNLSNVSCHHNAVSDVNFKKLKTQLPDYNKKNNFGGIRVKNLNKKIHYTLDYDFVESITIDSFKEKIDFIKIDVEGMEEEVLNGGIKTISLSRPICLIEVRYSNQIKICSFFKQLNYKIYERKNADLLFIPSESELIKLPHNMKEI